MDIAKTNLKKKGSYLQRSSHNFKQQLRKSVNDSRPYQKSFLGAQLYRFNKRNNTQADEVRYSQSKNTNRKIMYLLPKNSSQIPTKLARKSYSREIQKSKLFHDKSFDCNRLTFNDFAANQLKQLQFNHAKKSNKKCSMSKKNLKKMQSPYDKKLKQETSKIKKIQNKQNVRLFKMVGTRRIQTEAEPQKIQSPQHNKLKFLQQIGQGTFGKVYKALYIPSNQIVAVKKVFQDKKYKSREEEIVAKLNSPFVMKTLSSFTTYQNSYQGFSQYLNIVMDYYDCNLYEFISENKSLPNSLLMKAILYQIFRGLLYIHSLGICHRDIKPHNMLVKNNRLVICDFGSAKILKPQQPNLSYICSRCYRAPQLIFGSAQYTTKIDIWAAGCIILQILNRIPLFIGQNSLDHLVQIIKVMGTPTKQEVIAMNPQYNLKDYDFPKIEKKSWNKLFPAAENSLIDLVSKIMVYSPQQRLAANQVLAHPYFDQLREQKTQKNLSRILNPKDFFSFSTAELNHYPEISKLTPSWYR